MKISTNLRTAALRHDILIREVVKGTEAPKVLSHAAVVELANFGFLVDPKALEGASTKELQVIINTARSVAGGDRDMVPTYPNFPKGVQETDTLTLIFEQLLHYWTGGVYMPDQTREVRPGLSIEDMVHNARKVRVATLDECAEELVKSFVNAPIAMSADDRALLTEVVSTVQPSLSFVAEQFGSAKNFENAQALVIAAFNTGIASVSDFIIQLAPKARTVDALLRLVLAVSTTAVPGHEDAADLAVLTLADSKAYGVRFGSLPRSARKAIMNRLGELTDGFRADLLVARENLWRRTMRSIHPFSLKLSAGALRAANIIHDNGDYRTLNSLVEASIADGDVITTVKLLSENRPSELLRRLVAILRKVSSDTEAAALANGVAEVGSKAPLTTLISAYNGVLAANDDHARVTRVAGLNNTMRTAGEKVSDAHVAKVSDALMSCIFVKVAKADAPTGPVGVKDDAPVALVRRDAASSDRILDRGQRMKLDGEGSTLRVFCHWENNHQHAGFIDIGIAILDADFEVLAVSTWNSWSHNRDWATYSGDKCVQPGDSAAEFFDADLAKVRKVHPKAVWLVLTLQSWSSFPLDKTPILAGAMLRKKPNSGEVFDPRTVVTAFQPTTTSMQAIPLAYNLLTEELVWLDTSSGSMDGYTSAIDDPNIGTLVYDEVARPRLTNGELAAIWAKAHGATTTDNPVDRSQITTLLGL